MAIAVRVALASPSQRNASSVSSVSHGPSDGFKESSNSSDPTAKASDNPTSVKDKTIKSNVVTRGLDMWCAMHRYGPTRTASTTFGRIDT